MSVAAVRRAGSDEAAVVAELLDAFNREFDSPTPGTGVLTDRLQRLLGGDDLVALLHGDPPDGLAVVSLRPNPWSDGPVALLDELYVRPDRRGHRIGSALLGAVLALARSRAAELVEVPVDGDDVDARRFYEAHGFARYEPGATEPTFLYHRAPGGPGVEISPG